MFSLLPIADFPPQLLCPAWLGVGEVPVIICSVDEDGPEEAQCLQPPAEGCWIGDGAWWAVSVTPESGNAYLEWWLLWDLLVLLRYQSCPPPPPEKKSSLVRQQSFTAVTRQLTYEGQIHSKKGGFGCRPATYKSDQRVEIKCMNSRPMVGGPGRLGPNL